MSFAGLCLVASAWASEHSYGGDESVDSGYVEADGYSIYYERYGTGSPIVLVHGWGSNGHANWVASGWVEQLAPLRSVVVLDVRGHGQSDKPLALEPYSYAAMSADVLAVMDKLEIAEADFMGYSMGAFMGAYLLGHHADRFSSMILGGIGDETEASAAQGDAIAAALRAVEGSSIAEGYGKQVREFVMQDPNNDLEALAFSAQKMWPEGYPLKVAGPDIGQAMLPILIVNGANDFPYVETADNLAAALPNARHVRIADRDHLTVVADPRFMQVVTEFLTHQ